MSIRRLLEVSGGHLSPETWAWLDEQTTDEAVRDRLRRVSDGQGCHPMLDWQLELRPIRFAQARAFIARHHVHCPPPVAWRFGVSVANGHQVVGVFYGVALSSCFAQRSPVFVHASLTHGLPD